MALLLLSVTGASPGAEKVPISYADPAAVSAVVLAAVTIGFWVACQYAPAASSVAPEAAMALSWAVVQSSTKMMGVLRQPTGTALEPLKMLKMWRS